MKFQKAWFLLLVPTLLLASEKKHPDQFDIAYEVHKANPKLSTQTAFHYAKQIEKAARKYHISPIDLAKKIGKKGHFTAKAGLGLGICRIPAQVLKDTKFKKEFPKVKAADLRNADKSFVYAAYLMRSGDRKHRTIAAAHYRLPPPAQPAPIDIAPPPAPAEAPAPSPTAQAAPAPAPEVAQQNSKQDPLEKSLENLEPTPAEGGAPAAAASDSADKDKSDEAKLEEEIMKNKD